MPTVVLGALTKSEPAVIRLAPPAPSDAVRMRHDEHLDTGRARIFLSIGPSNGR